MEHSKLIRTLSALTEQELKAFRKWAFEGQVKETNDVFRLFDYILRFAPTWNGQELEKEKIFEVLFPEHSYDDRIIRRIMSDLLTCVKEYIILYIQKNEIQKDMTMASFYLDRKNLTEYALILEEIGRKLASITFDTDLSLFQKYQWEKQKALKSGIPQITHKIKSFEKVFEALDIFYLTTSLHYNSLALNNSREYTNSVQKMSLALHIIKESPHYLSHPLIALYYKTYLLWDESEGDIAYDNLQVWLAQHEHLISMDDQSIVAKLMRNYCVREILLGRKEFFEKLEKLMELHFAKGFLFEMGYITYTAFNNMITLYLRQNKIMEARKFVVNYSLYLKEENREGILCLVEIKIDFVEKNYKGVLQKSSTMEGIADLVLNFEARRWRAKALFMLEEYEVLNSYLDATRMSLHRNKENLNEVRHASNQLFIKYMRKLITLNLYEKKEVQRLYVNVCKEGDFVEKEWIAETLLSKGAKPLQQRA